MTANAPRHLPVYVVLAPQTMMLDVAGPLDVLRYANILQERVFFDVRYVGPAPSVLTSVGLTLTGIEPLPPQLPSDALVMLVGDVDEVLPASRNMPREELRAQQDAIVDWLRAAIQPGQVLVSICSGALLAARAGLLDGYTCTTHYIDCQQLAALAPRAHVLDNRLYVEDRDRLTSAGVTAGIDLMLYLVSRYVDHACALAVARYLVVYLRRGGADPQLSPWLEGRNHIHPAIHRVQDAVAADPTRDWTLSALADVAGASTRHLSRLFNEHVGMSITDYRNRLRVAVARELLGHTRLDMEQVAERAGFASTRQLRRAWRQYHPTSPKEARTAALHA
jgi:transcriptional regulator GlxA family with amidase domain